jgi:Tol biopolymer transport system component
VGETALKNMRIILKFLKFILLLVVAYYCLYFFFVYKDVVLSLPFKKSLKGKIVYSLKGHYINVIEFPSCKKTTIYRVPLETLHHLGFVGNPYFSPDGERIVFSQSQKLFDDSLYIMDKDGKNVDMLLYAGTKDSYRCPSWSNDGKKIAFVTQKSREEGLYSLSLESNVIKHVINIQPGIDQPSWSPDSKMIAFSYENKVRQYIGRGLVEERNLGGIYIVDAETGQVKRRVELAKQPAISPDGELLVYERKDGYYITDLYDDSGYNEYLLIPTRTIIGGSTPIRWSPDGKYLVFCKEIWPYIEGIYVISLDNPKRHIRIATEERGIIGMSWAK